MRSLRHLRWAWWLAGWQLLLAGCTARDTGADGSTAGDELGDGATSDGSETGTGSETTDGETCPAIELLDVDNGMGGFAIHGAMETHWLGRGVTDAGDLNGDGLSDVFVGAAKDPDDEGVAYLVYGTGDTSPIEVSESTAGSTGFAVHGLQPDDDVGTVLSGGGDVNGDGLADLAIGVWRVDRGQAYVVFGTADTTPIQLSEVGQGAGGFSMVGAADANSVGRSLAIVGDMNGDGLAEVLVGSNEAAYLVFGKQDTTQVQLADIVAGSGGFAIFGVEVGSDAGDVNGDGIPDIVVGAPDGSLEGKAYVVFGKADTVPVDLPDVEAGSGGFVMPGAEAIDQAGSLVNTAGDVNGDGFADVLVGALPDFYDGRPDRVYVVFGKADTTPRPLADVEAGIGGFFMESTHRVSLLGSISEAGDLDGDGLDDVVVGGHLLDSSPGAYVVFGKTDTTPVRLPEVADGVGGFAIHDRRIAEGNGPVVSTAGDVDGDGTPDLLIGTSGVGSGGAAYVVFGGDFSCG